MSETQKSLNEIRIKELEAYIGEKDAKIKEKEKDIEEHKKELLEKAEMISTLNNYISILDLKFNILQSIGKTTSSEFDLDNLLNRIMDEIIATTKVQAGSLLLLDPETNLLVFKVAKGEKGSEVKKYKIPLGEGIVGWVAQTGRPKITPEVESDSQYKKEIAEEIDFKVNNILCVPMKVQDKVIGVIELINKISGRRFRKDDLDLLTSLAGQIGLIINNAFLHQETQNKIRDLSHMIEVSAAINSSLNLTKVLNRVMETAAKILGAETSSIFLVDEEKQELYIEIATGEIGQRVKQIRMPMDKGVVGTVVKEGKSQLVADAQNDPRFYKKVDEKSQFVTKSMVAVPLKVRGKIIGVVEVLNKINGTFGKNDVAMLEGLAHQSAIAIDNARTHRELRDLFFDVIKSLAVAVESKDHYTGGHIDRIANISIAIAKELGLPDEDVERVHWAALFHDLGKIGVDEAILRKPGRLNDEEWKQLKEHPAIGANILQPIKQFQHIIPGILHHQEYFNGSGYPAGLKGEEISVDGRIIGVADCFDAMTSDRPYRKGLPEERAIEEIKRCSGTQFDPKVAEAFLSAYSKGMIYSAQRLEKEYGLVQKT